MPKKHISDLQEGDIIAKIKTTNGIITVQLFAENVPFTVSNFVGLAQKGYYDGIIFHRIINNFMIQWWDPTGTWMWWESIYWEKFNDEFHSSCRNNKYTLSMANSWPNTNGSQFFINQNDNNYLDNKHSVFGEVVDGHDSVDKIAKLKTDNQDRPKKEVKIIDITLEKYVDGSFETYVQDTQQAIDNYKTSLEKVSQKKKDLKIQKGSTATVHYTLTLEDGSIKDSSHNRGEPFTFVVWEWQVIAWWDAWVIGKSIHDAFKLEVEPVDGYWEYDEEKMKIMPRTELQSFIDAGIPLEVWEKLPTQYGYFTIKEATPTDITIDINHELAWKKLLFDIEIIDIA